MKFIDEQFVQHGPSRLWRVFTDPLTELEGMKEGVFYDGPVPYRMCTTTEKNNLLNSGAKMLTPRGKVKLIRKLRGEPDLFQNFDEAEVAEPTVVDIVDDQDAFDFAEDSVDEDEDTEWEVEEELEEDREDDGQAYQRAGNFGRRSDPD